MAGSKSMYKSKNRSQLQFAYKNVVSSLGGDVTSREQLMRVFQCSGKNPTLKEIKKIWSQYNGTMSFDDVDEAISKLKSISRSELISAFKKIDINNDGFITESELYKILTTKGEKMTHAEVRRILANADENKDGKLDYNEFSDMMLSTCNKVQNMKLDDDSAEEVDDEADADNNGNSRSTAGSVRSVASKRGLSSRPTSAHSIKSVALSERSHRGQLSRKSSVSSNLVSSSDKNRRPYNISLVKTEEINPSTFQVKLPAVESIRQNISAPATLKGWNKAFSKGCFFVDDKDVVTSHLYKLELPFASNLWITLATTAAESAIKSDNVDAGFFIYRKNDEDGNEDVGDLISFSESKLGEEWCWRGDLRSGSYTLVPYTTGCKLKHKQRENDDDDEIEEEVKLTYEDSSGEIQLSKLFRKTLSDIFDICDLNGDGKLSREEFNWFQIVTSEEEVDDESWEVVKDSVEMDGGEITSKGFYELYLMQAREEGIDPQEELMETLQALGFTSMLKLDKACPFQLNVHAKDCRPSLTVTSLSTGDDDLLTKGFSESSVVKGKRIEHLELPSKQVTCYLYKNLNRMATVIHNESTKSVIVNVDCSNSENCLMKQSKEIYSVEAAANSKSIIDHILPANQEYPWIYECEIKTSRPKPSSRASRRLSISSGVSKSSRRSQKAADRDIFR